MLNSFKLNPYLSNYDDKKLQKEILRKVYNRQQRDKFNFKKDIIAYKL